MQRSYDELIKRVPILKYLIDNGDAEALETLYKNVRILEHVAVFSVNKRLQLRQGSDMARGDDTGKLKSAVVEWVNDLYGPSNPPLRSISKYERGLNNDHTGWLLCPGEYDWDDMRSVQILKKFDFDLSLLLDSNVCHAVFEPTFGMVTLTIL
jgi:hypothetical protein